MARKKNINKTTEEKQKINIIAQECQKLYGNNVLITPKDTEQINKHVAKNMVCPSGSVSFDKMTGVGGLVKGRIYLAYGNYGLGKTTTTLALYKEAAKQDYALVFSDHEHRLDLGLVDKMGIDRFDPEKFFLIVPKYAMDALDIIMKLLQMNKKLFIIIDSISSFKVRPSEKKSETYGDGKRMGQVAAMLSEFLKDVTPLISATQSILIMISQIRMQGIASGMAYRLWTGGQSVGFYPTMIWEVSKGKGNTSIVEDGQIVGNELTWKCKKVSTTLPQSDRTIAIKYGYGFWPEYEITRIGEQTGVVQVSGAWYKYGEITGQGIMNFVKSITENRPVFNKLKKEVLEKYK